MIDRIDFEGRMNDSSCAAIAPEMVRDVLAYGPGSVIAYDWYRDEYSALRPGAVTHHGERRQVAVWGYGDISSEIQRCQADGFPMAYFAAALMDTGMDYLDHCYHGNQAPDWVGEARDVVERNGFVVNQRSDRDLPRSFRDHFVRRSESELRLTLNYRKRPGSHSVQVQLRMWDLGRQVSGSVFSAPESAVGRSVRHFLREAMAARVRRAWPEY